MNIINNALYTLKDDYFIDYKNKYLIDNKNENRPFYYALKDDTHIIWLIPLSSQTNAYKKKIAADIKKRGNCLFYQIGKIAGIERIFLIGNIIPTSATYIKAPFTINNKHYIIQEKDLINEIDAKAKKYIALVKTGKLKPNLDILKIHNDLLIKTNAHNQN